MITLTREELYNRVWKTPMLKLAKDFGLSDNGLRKICIKHKIPVPETGYWSRLRNGYKVKQKKLPPISEKQLKTIYIKRNSLQNDALLVKAREFERDIPNIVILKEEPFIPIVERTFNRIKGRIKKDNTEVIMPPINCLDIRIGSIETLERACKTINGLLLYFTREGYKFGITKGTSKTWVKINGEQVEFAIIERAKRVKTKRYEYDCYVLEKSNKLSLTINHEMFGISYRRHWNDGNRQKIEQMLPKFVVGLKVCSQAIKIEREIYAKRDFEYSVERRKYLSEKKQKKVYELKLEKFEKQFNAWQKADRLRQFVNSYKQNKTGDTFQTIEWLRFAQEQIDKLDPFQNGVPDLKIDESEIKCNYSSWL